MKTRIESSLKAFQRNTLLTSAQGLFNLLGYQSTRRMRLESNNAEEFLKHFAQFGDINSNKAEIQDWDSVNLLFQLTKSEIVNNDQLEINFEDQPLDETLIQSYLFFVLELKGPTYNRTQLTAITREINKLTPMPAIVLFKYGIYLALAVIDRRPGKRDVSRDVLEKIALIEDIDSTSPHRAHIQILFDLSLSQLYYTYQFRTFLQFHLAWQETLHSFNPSELNRTQSTVNRYDATVYPSQEVAEIHIRPFSVIPELYGLPYEELFYDTEYDAPIGQRDVASSFVSGRYIII